jgi:hypothetical protein
MVSVISDGLTKKCARDPAAANAVVITLKDGVSPSQRQAILDRGAVPIAGSDTFFTGSFDTAALQALAALDDVDHIDEDLEVRAL